MDIRTLFAPVLAAMSVSWLSGSGQNFRCTVNPYVSHEEDPHFQVPKAEHPGKVLVIGGGPAGISAAVLSAQAGHQVELWEKSQELGGNLNAAGAPSFKKDLMSYRDYLLRCLEISGVTVCLGQEATVERVKESGAEQVIYAAGATAPDTECARCGSASCKDCSGGPASPGKAVPAMLWSLAVGWWDVRLL